MKAVSRTQAETKSPVVASILQRTCACGGTSGPTGDCESWRKKRLQRKPIGTGANHQRSTLNSQPSEVPPIVHEVLRSPGQPLDAATRVYMERRFNHDFSKVRVRAYPKAEESAQAVGARAYTVGRNLVFARGHYRPDTLEGHRLIAHELAHVVQQSQSGSAGEAEQGADTAAERIVGGQSVSRQLLGGAEWGLHAQTDEEETPSPAGAATPAFTLNWDELLLPDALRLPSPTLQVPSLTPPSLGVGTLRQPSSLAPPSLALPPPWLPPPVTREPSEPSAAPALPSRLSLTSCGRFSLGLRLGFPETEQRKLPGAPPSALAESLRRAEIMNQMLTGRVPTGWEAIDKGKLAQALWGIFSTHLAPDVARNITSRLPRRAGPPGMSYELDIVLLTDFSGGGLSFAVNY